MQQQFNEKNRDLVVNIDRRLVQRDAAGFTGSDYSEPPITRISPMGLESSV